jgi:3-oxoadipate enol-lactonase
VPTVRIDDLEVYYELHGDPSAPPILVISGSGGDLRQSMPAAFPLNRIGYCCHYDQRGLGQTSKPADASAYSMAQYADDAAALVRALGFRQCHVVGTSFGGMVALNLVVRHPELVQRLVLNCTSPGGTHASFPLDSLSQLPADERRERILGLFDSRYDPAAEQPFPGLSREQFETYTAGLVAARSGEALVGYQRQLAARATHDVVAALANIAAPTLICAGWADLVAPPANSQLMAARIPGAQLEVFDGGHLFMLQDRRAFARMREFLSS